ncbi:SGNH/GDSL hydrolase family protein [Pedobacter heparinus]|uniref:SGNH/GDSL hydrolase family protein n=1 Tax=Pedobacter heparinus TaxID=984 RepID=UPI002931994A|nr:SGNH/GDSL hydrolase family protein [Pedobacter heparinus]
MHLKHKLILHLAFLVLTLNGFTQELNKPLFPGGSKVCFIGNSITNNGEYYNDLWMYYATRFPNEQIHFYNCGISGDVAGGILRRMEKDVMIHQPTHAVMMIGMNDVKRNLYGKANANEALKQKALTDYNSNTDTAVNILKKRIGNVILLKPSIYDQTSAIETENLYGVNDALQRCAEQMQTLSEKYQTGLVDFQTILLRINKEEQLKNPAFTIIGKDRVHPLSPGHFVMAYQFLKDTNAPKYVSKLVIGDDLKASQKASFNAEIRKQSNKNNRLTFECLEKSLPCPIKAAARKALDWTPFNEEFNMQLLQVKNLSGGNYNLFIDNILITSLTDKELSAGINLALFQNTPQYQQAIKVMEACIKYRDTESAIRNLRFVEFTQLSGLKEPSDLTLVEQYLAKRLESLKDGGHYDYYQKQFKNYLLKKSNEAEVLRQLPSLSAVIYQVNQPKVHTFKIEKQP